MPFEKTLDWIAAHGNKVNAPPEDWTPNGVNKANFRPIRPLPIPK